MKITLDKVLPVPLKNTGERSDVWGKRLEIAQGSIVEINAPSARGKTTLLSIIYGLRNDYEGDVRLDKKSIRSVTENEWPDIRNRFFSILFQDLRLFDFLSGYENILVKSNIASNTDKESIVVMAERLEISAALEKPVRELSWGEKQRIAILRALVQPFRFLLLDEPWSHLDKQRAKKVCALVLERCEKNKAAVLCTTLDKSEMLPFTVRVRV